MIRLGIVIIGIVFILMAILLRQNRVAAILAARQKEVVNVGDLTNWWKLNLASMGGLVIITGVAALFFTEKSPWLFWAAALFIMAVFCSLLLMGYRLLLKKDNMKDQ